MEYHKLLNKILDNAFEKMRSIEEDELSYKKEAAKWSKKEILGHLIDSAYNNHQRFLRANTQSDLIFQGYQQATWVSLHDYQNRTSEELLSTWLTVNKHLSQLIERLPKELMTRSTTKHNFHQICMNRLKEGESTSLSYLLWDYLFHLEHHLKQIIPDYIPSVQGMNGQGLSAVQ